MKTCSPNSVDFDECCFQSAREAIPSVLKGDRRYNIPEMLPLVLPSVTLDSGPDFSLVITDLHVYGLQNIELKNIKFDLKNKKNIGTVLFSDKFELVGLYEINGRILVIPIRGKGDLNVTTVGCTVDYSTDYVLENRDGEDYISVTKGTSDISMKKAYYRLTNLYNGNKELGMEACASESTNRALNENWEQVLDTLKPVITETVVRIANAIANGVASQVPYKEIFKNQ
ncbi:hypothetical protein NQ315_017207 [Exocentrus adspersus]|uniref:Uncharacterized protein n=1 Tax=Exocentrus adspersus TaxID=1586481 RepID=A0AAV8V952_9CUCU|nr:hypothetical protein NQ315_017207 [Exocentrus adspersus]